MVAVTIRADAIVFHVRSDAIAGGHVPRWVGLGWGRFWLSPQGSRAPAGAMGAVPSSDARVAAWSRERA